MPIAVVSIPVKDQAAAKAFYADTLGFTCLRDEAMGPDMRWVQLQPKTGGATIALVTWFEAMQPGGLQGLLIHVADIDAEHARLSALGIEVTAIEEQPWGRFTIFHDPDGNGLIFAQLAAPEQLTVR